MPKTGRPGDPVSNGPKTWPSVSACARDTGLSRETINRLLDRGDAHLIGTYKPRKGWTRAVEYQGVTYPNRNALCAHLRVTPGTVRNMIRRGQAIDRSTYKESPE